MPDYRKQKSKTLAPSADVYVQTLSKLSPPGHTTQLPPTDSFSEAQKDHQLHDDLGTGALDISEKQDLPLTSVTVQGTMNTQ